MVPFTDLRDLCLYREVPTCSQDLQMVYPDWLRGAMANYPAAPDHDHVSAFLLALADLHEVRRSAPTGEAGRNARLRARLRPGPHRLESAERHRHRTGALRSARAWNVSACMKRWLQRCRSSGRSSFLLIPETARSAEPAPKGGGARVRASSDAAHLAGTRVLKGRISTISPGSSLPCEATSHGMERRTRRCFRRGLEEDARGPLQVVRHRRGIAAIPRAVEGARHEGLAGLSLWFGRAAGCRWLDVARALLPVARCCRVAEEDLLDLRR